MPKAVITNKQNPSNMLYGEIIKHYPDYPFPGGSLLDFRIAGTKEANSFNPDEWVIEEQIELPTNQYAVIQFEDSAYGGERIFWLCEDDGWVETDGDWYDTERLLGVIKERAVGGKFEVLHEGAVK